MIFLALVGPAVNLGFGQSSPDVKGILEGMSKAYQNASQYEVVEITTMELDAGNSKGISKSKIRIVSQKPNKFRLETEDVVEIDGVRNGSFRAPMVLTGDGTDVWEVSPTVNQYTKARPSDLQRIQRWVKDVEKSVFDPPTIYGKEIGNSTFIREESLALDGKNIDCFVVKLVLPDHAESTMLWVEKARFLVRRIRLEQGPSAETQGRTVSTTSDFPIVKIGVALPDSTFVFTPSPSATEVDKVTQ